ncbi:hypothetical protein HZC00_03580 [Candidatus Kaiserbacteria bacterium]|nr:hypothetical protein [Candidatus Kaiserbacteria bacterium]
MSEETPLLPVGQPMSPTDPKPAPSSAPTPITHSMPLSSAVFSASMSDTPIPAKVPATPAAPVSPIASAPTPKPTTPVAPITPASTPIPPVSAPKTAPPVQVMSSAPKATESEMIVFNPFMPSTQEEITPVNAVPLAVAPVVPKSPTPSSVPLSTPQSMSDDFATIIHESIIPKSTPLTPSTPPVTNRAADQQSPVPTDVTHTAPVAQKPEAPRTSEVPDVGLQRMPKPPMPVNGKPTLAEALKPYVKQATASKGPSMAVSVFLIPLAAAIVILMGVGIRFVAPTLVNTLKDILATSNLSLLGTQVGPPVFVAFVLMLLCWWWGREIQVGERRAVIGFLWGVSLYTLLTYALLAGYKYGFVPYAAAQPQDGSFEVALMASIVAPLWFVAMFGGLILTMSFLVMSSTAQPRIPPLMASVITLASRWLVVLIAIIASLYVFDAASYFAPLTHQPMLCQYQYNAAHRDSCMGAMGVSSTASAAMTQAQ